MEGQILSLLPSSFRRFSALTRVNKIEILYRRSRVYVKVESRSHFTFKCGLSYITSISFTNVHFTYIRTEKLRDSGNQPLCIKGVSKNALKSVCSVIFINDYM